jgi:predicted N-acyltransferase
LKDTKTYSYLIKTAIESIDGDQWDSVTKNSSVYLDRTYLRALEGSLDSKHQCYYVLVKDKELRAVSVIVFQSAPFVYTKDKHSKKVSCHFGKTKQGYFSKQLLVCGNVFATGETGFSYSKDINTSQMGKVLIEATSRVLKFQKKNEHFARTKVSIFKEFWPDSLKIPAQLLDSGYQNYQIDVNMVLPIVAHWNSFDDYLQDVKAKYRTRANSVFKKAEGIEIISLDENQIINFSILIDGLFENVISQSDYRFGEIRATSFAALKREMGDKFIFKGLFKGQKLLGFSTAFLNGEVLEANYVGIDYDFNGKYAIYQRLLYDYVEEAIIANVSSLQLGRTSELLKSSLGAVPISMTLFAKHNTSITHLLMASILKKLSASPYELRKPFKSTFYETDLSPLA